MAIDPGSGSFDGEKLLLVSLVVQCEFELSQLEGLKKAIVRTSDTKQIMADPMRAEETQAMNNL